ncbi:MAG: response regulator [Nitrospirales bacterium]
MRKTALIVDDSKSATMVLKRLLESHDLDVDTAESAEAALEYLIDHRPDVVFMDHMMPGMDGFQAVTAIKSNPDTATIPIMMYTSQEGEVYVGQARALGAVGVLPKKVEPVEVSKVLRSLRVIGDEAERRKTSGKLPAEGANDEYPGIDKLDKELRILIQDLFDQQRAVLRRDLLDSYETIAARVAEEIRAPVVAVEEIPEIDEAAGPDIPARLKIAIALLSVLVITFAWLYWLRVQSWQEIQQENSLLRDEIEHGSSNFAENASAIRNRIDELQESLGTAYSVALSSIEWGANQAARYDFDELPLGDRRRRLFSEMSDRLLEIGFSGVVRVESHVGDFCMIAAGPASYILPPPDWDAGGCDAIGFGDDESVDLGLRQSVGFANFVNVSGEQTQGRIRFEIVSLGNSDPVLPYPNSFTGLSAAEWNEISEANNRVVVSIRPDSRSPP